MPSATEANSNSQPTNLEFHAHTTCIQHEDGGMEYDTDLAANSEWASEEEFSDDCVSPGQVIPAASDDESWPGDDIPEHEGDLQTNTDAGFNMPQLLAVGLQLTRRAFARAHNGQDVVDDEDEDGIPDFLQDLNFRLSLDKKHTRALVTQQAVDNWKNGGDAPCTFADCPVKAPHNNGRYIHEGAEPVHHYFFGTCKPPPEVFESFKQIERFEVWEEDEEKVLGFVGRHVRLWAGETRCDDVCEMCEDVCEGCKMAAEVL